MSPVPGAWLAALLLASCGEPEPAAIDVPAALALRDLGPHELPVRVLDADGVPLSVPWRLEVDRPGVLQAGDGGVLRCLAHGASRVDVLAGPLRRAVVVRCDLARGVEVKPERLWLVVGSERGGALDWRVLGPGGEPLQGVEAHVAVVDPSVARWDGERVRPVALGRTQVRVSAGEEAVGVVDVRVGRRVLARRRVPVPSGTALEVPMDDGLWRIVVTASRPVEIQARNGRCDGRAGRSARSHRRTCTFEAGGTLVVRRPGIRGLGGDARVDLVGTWYPAS